MKSPSRRRVIFSLCCLLSCAFAGCSKQAPSTPGEAPGRTAQPPAAAKVAQPPVAEAPVPAVWQESFDSLNVESWRNVEVTRLNKFESVDLEGRQCLRVDTNDSASLLVHTMMINPEEVPWLSWEWRVDEFVPGESLYEKTGSDASARVYVYFDTLGLPWQKRNIDYVWSKTLPVGTVLESPYSASSKIIVAASGLENKGKWVKQSHNLDEDYQRCFGGKTPKVVAIGLMADTDSAGGKGLAYFDDVRLTRQKPGT